MNKSFYFQHDYNSANDVKILYLRQQLGIEGYGIFWFIIEQLAQAGGKLPLKVIPVLAMQIQTTADKVASVINNYELFEIENQQFFSIRLLEQIEFRTQLSQYGKKGGLKSAETRAKNKQIQAPLEAPLQAKSKQSKGKESKEDLIEPDIFDYPTPEELFKELTSTTQTYFDDVHRLVRVIYQSAEEVDTVGTIRQFLILNKATGELEKPFNQVRKHLAHWIQKQTSDKIQSYGSNYKKYAGSKAEVL